MKRCECGREMEIYTQESVNQSPPLVREFWRCSCGKEVNIEIKPA